MRAKYSQEFKDEAVALALSSDLSYSRIASDLGVNYQTFGNWMRAAMSKQKDAVSDNKKVTKQDYQSLERELKAARKELDLRKREIEFLKKASMRLYVIESLRCTGSMQVAMVIGAFIMSYWTNMSTRVHVSAFVNR